MAAEPKKPFSTSNGHTTPDKWAKLHPSQRVQIEHMRDELKERADKSGAAPLQDQGTRRPEGRYKVIVLDVPESAHRVAVQECAVFLVPQVCRRHHVFNPLPVIVSSFKSGSKDCIQHNREILLEQCAPKLIQT